MIRAYVFLFACDFDGGRIWVARATNECAALQIQIRSAKRRPSRNWFGGRRRSCFVLCFGRAYRILRPTPNNGLPLGGRIVTARIREQILDTLLAKPQRPETS